MDCLRQTAFPGNIRELRNILERAGLLADQNTIMSEHLPETCQRMDQQAFDGDTSELVTQVAHERCYLIRTLAVGPNDRQALADLLVISRHTLFRKLEQSKKDL